LSLTSPSARLSSSAEYLAALTRLSSIYNLAVFITNQVTADPGASAMFGDTKKPIGGHVLAHASTVRISLKKGRGEQRIAKIYDSPDMPEADCTFQITVCLTALSAAVSSCCCLLRADHADTPLCCCCLRTAASRTSTSNCAAARCSSSLLV